MNSKILEAIKSMSNNNFDKAYSLLKEAYINNPKNPNLNFYLANLCLRYNEFKNGLKHIIISLKNNPDNEDYNNIAGILLYKLGIYSLSKKFFEKTLDLVPNHEGAFTSLKAIEDLGYIEDSDIDNDIEEVIKEFNKMFIDFRYSKLPTLSVCIIAKNEEKTYRKSNKECKKHS
ncbi:MAG: hypothetical protein KatS3mg068_2080 [Candidatus Sericytochromatia bacterium]|nr:MAG: hypothetical protein KatS3mg068_2080 [Candidatus Sericytochromatia bacterium]